jgi:hypothetical protein
MQKKGTFEISCFAKLIGTIYQIELINIILPLSYVWDLSLPSQCLGFLKKKKNLYTNYIGLTQILHYNFFKAFVKSRLGTHPPPPRPGVIWSWDSFKK